MIDECGISGVVYTEDTMSGVIDEGGSIQGQMDGDGNLVGEVGFPKCCCDYDELVNRPSINGVELVGNKTTEDLGIEAGVQSVNGQTGDVVLDIPTKTSNLTNDSGFITDTEVPSYEQDPVFSSSVAHGITSSDITNWNNKSDFSGSYNDLTDKPTIPDVATKYDSNDSTETALADDDKIPFYDTSASGQRNSTWANIKAKLKAYFDGIYSTFSGSYNDLTDKPTIPTVNNATLTIQENGVDVQTFTANASSDATANITVPTKVSDLTNDIGFLTSIDSSDVTTALGYTPYNDTNPSGYVNAQEASSAAPVQSVNGETGSVSLDASDVGALADTTKYALGESVGGNAVRTNGILYGEVDSTSTSTVYTASISGVSSYYDGLTILLRNGVVTSASGFTININGLGAKPVYNNMATGNPITPTNPTRETTVFNINYTMLLIYNSTLVTGGAFILYRGYWSDANSIGYQLRTNSTIMTVTDTARYYKIYFTSADGTQWVPASVNSKNDATTARAVNQRPINPFGRIVYTSASTNYTAGSNLSAGTVWDRYTLVLGYSFNVNGGALTLTSKKPVYLKCAPQSDGSAIMDSATPIVQDLPTTEDGKIYIWLGIAYDATHIELHEVHPVYYYKDSAIRLWTNASGGSATEIVYCTCTDSASTVAKTATIVNGNLSSLTAGTIVAVKFDYQNTAASPTLDVGNTGAKSIKRYGTTAVGQNVNESWNAGSIVLLVYDGTNWIVTDFLNTTYSGGVATAITAGTDNLNYIWSPKQIHDGIDSMLPTIPTVNDATLTIQKNSTDVATFTANASSNVVADISVPTDTSDLTNGAGYITSSDLPTNLSDLNNDLDVSDFNNDAGYITGMYIGSYGHSTYAEVLAAYQADKVVYCRASSNSNPATGNQLRMAFLAYVNDQTTPTEFEFQYYRSVATHSNTQQGDQVYVYKLNKNTGWSVTVREAYTKIVAGSGLTSSYSNGVLTISLA